MKKLKKLIVIDSSYSYEAIVSRDLQSSVLCRDLNGYFSHVWSVHPFASLVTSCEWVDRYGKPVFYQLSCRHTFIEGKVGRYNFLKIIGGLNFALSQISIFFLLLKIIRNEGVDVIRAGSPLYVGLFSWGLSRLGGIPFVVRVGGNHDRIYADTGKMQEPRLFGFRFIEKLVERFIFKRADLVAGANQDNLDFAIDNGASPEKSTIFRYGNLIDARHFIPPEERNRTVDGYDSVFLDKQFILYVGRLEPVKRPQDVLILLSKLITLKFDICAVLVGEGRLDGDLKNLARSLNIADRVYFMGNRDQGWLSSVLPLCSVFVSPHTGRALTEAALAGAPVVAYDIDWQGELIISGKTGELVSFGDVDSLTDSAVKIISNQAYASEIRLNLRDFALKIMDPDLLNKHEVDSYDLLLSG